MNALKELLASLLTEELINDDVHNRLVEAYEFDAADYAEQLGTIETANGEANTQIAALTEQVATLTNEINAVKAMNLDKLLNGNVTGDGVADTNSDTDSIDDADITLDELIEQAQQKDDA